jgi:hypothetical protein
MSGNIVDEQGWTIAYNALKNDHQAKRKFNPMISESDGKAFLQRIQLLERSLAVMKDSPMEYELSASEIARRLFVLDALRKLIVSVCCWYLTVSLVCFSNNLITHRLRQSATCRH